MTDESFENVCVSNSGRSYKGEVYRDRDDVRGVDGEGIGAVVKEVTSQLRGGWISKENVKVVEREAADSLLR